MLRRTSDDYEPDVDEPEDSPDDEVRGRRRGGRKTTFFLLLFALAFLTVAVLRVLGVDGNQVTVPAIAMTPYIAPGGVLLALIAFVLRRRIMAVAVLLMALSMLVLLAPRYFSNEQPSARGPHVRVLSANVDRGEADVATILNLVQDNAVDVLTLPELTRSLLFQLDEAGLATVLPYRVVDAQTGSNGILSRHPLREIILTPNSSLPQPAAVVDLPGRDDIEVVAVHIKPPTQANAWHRDLADLPPPSPPRIRVLAGDFNATYDHATFRAILDRGYVDTAEQTGHGLIPTWSTWRLGPPITIDHILTDHRCAVASYSVLRLPGSDHSAILADLVLP